MIDIIPGGGGATVAVPSPTQPLVSPNESSAYAATFLVFKKFVVNVIGKFSVRLLPAIENVGAVTVQRPFDDDPVPGTIGSSNPVPVSFVR